MTKKLEPVTFKFILLVNIVASTCCIIYELNLAQLLSATLGNTVLRYSLTVGIYLAAMGFGSIFLGKEDVLGDKRFQSAEQNLLKRLFKIEVILSLLGLISPLILLYFDALLRNQPGGIFNYNQIIGYLLVLVIGLFTGAELPTLLQLGKLTKPTESYWILIIDYVGTVAGSVIFPFYLVSNLGVIYTSVVVSFINFVLAVCIYIQTKSKDRLEQFLISLLFVVYMLLFLYFNEFSNWITNEVYLS